MTLRNFYIDCEIDGYKSRLTGGPHSKDGGFSLAIYQRSDGKKIEALNVVGRVAITGALSLEIVTHDSFIPVTSNKEVLLTRR